MMKWMTQQTRRFGLTTFMVLALGSTFVAAAQEAQTPDEICAANLPADNATTREFAAPEQVLEAGLDYRAVFCTDVGAVYIDLFEELTPVTVNSFVFLAQNDYYNNTTFHRVIDSFMAQGGDPTATGTGGPGYQFEDEFVGFLTFDRPGWLAMANAGAGTNGSQFFITTVPTEQLTNRHTIFGEVLEGQEAVETIRLRDPQTDSEPGTALQTVIILTDPAAVTTTYEAPPPATQEEIEAVLTELSNIPAPLALDESVHGIFDLAATTATAPETLQGDYQSLLEANNFDFRASTGVINPTCSLDQVPYYGVRYTLDAFATPEDAGNVLADGFLDTFAIENGFTEFAMEVPLVYPVYTRGVTFGTCEASATTALTRMQRGRFVVTAEATFPTDSPASADLWVTDLANYIYEAAFTDVLRAELR